MEEAGCVGLESPLELDKMLILARTSRNQKVSGLSGKLQITNPKLQTWGVLRTGLNAFGEENKMVSFI
jgi:hypothetical protein